MGQSPSWEANSLSATQEILRLLWNQKIHYRVHKSLSLVPNLTQLHPVHTFPPHFPKIQSCSHLLPSGFPTKILFAFLISYTRDICIPNQNSSNRN
jgi:hypothetical protein